MDASGRRKWNLELYRDRAIVRSSLGFPAMKKGIRSLLLGIAAAIAVVAISQLWGIAQTPPTPTPTPQQATPTPVPAPTAVPTSTPSPQASPAPAASPTVAPPEFSEPETASPQTPEVTVDLPVGEGTYSEADRFEIGILEGYELTPTAGVPLIESPEGDLAYTVLWERQATNTPLPAPALTQMAIDELEDGEGFQMQEIEASVLGAVLLSWSGTAKDTPVAGKVLVRQANDAIVMLIVAGSGEGVDRVDAAMSALAETLKTLNQ